MSYVIHPTAQAVSGSPRSRPSVTRRSSSSAPHRAAATGGSTAAARVINSTRLARSGRDCTPRLPGGHHLPLRARTSRTSRRKSRTIASTSQSMLCDATASTLAAAATFHRYRAGDANLRLTPRPECRRSSTDGTPRAGGECAGSGGTTSHDLTGPVAVPKIILEGDNVTMALAKYDWDDADIPVAGSTGLTDPSGLPRRHGLQADPRVDDPGDDHPAKLLRDDE